MHLLSLQVVNVHTHTRYTHTHTHTHIYGHKTRTRTHSYGNTNAQTYTQTHTHTHSLTHQWRALREREGGPGGQSSTRDTLELQTARLGPPSPALNKST